MADVKNEKLINDLIKRFDKVEDELGRLQGMLSDIEFDEIKNNYIELNDEVESANEEMDSIMENIRQITTRLQTISSSV